MQKILQQLKKHYKKILNYKYRKKIRSEKSKLFIQEKEIPRFQSKRTSFHLFKNKLEFRDEWENPKNYYVYYIVIWVFLILSTIYVMMFTHYFSLKTIDIIRLDENVNIDLSYKSIDNFRFQPILLIKKEDIHRNLLSHQPNIKDIQIKKILPSNIKIIVSSHENMFQFDFDNKKYIITKNGTLIPQKEESKLPSLKIIWLDTFWVIDYKKYFDEEIIAKISDILTNIESNFDQLQIQSLEYYKKEQELHILDEKWVRFLFHLEESPLPQIEKLKIFYTEYISKVKFALVYVDLRINERIIYCSKETEFQCNQNLNFLYDIKQ